MNIDDYIRFDVASWGDPQLDSKVKELADKYKIDFPDDTLRELTDRINLLFEADDDTRRYRETLQIFDLCNIQSDVNVRGVFSGEERTIKVDNVLFGVFIELRDNLIKQEYGNVSESEIKEIHEKLRDRAEKERREEVLFENKLTKEIVRYLRDSGVFRNPDNPTNLGNKEGAFIYDLLNEIGCEVENFGWSKVTNKTKRDAIKNRLK